MNERLNPYVHIQEALNRSDIEFLRRTCKRQVSEQGIPCYALIDSRDSSTYLKIKEVLEKRLGEPLYYLNDFYIYTDSSFKTGWHMDTELFTFDRAVNAWILLAPENVTEPLGFIDRINDSPQNYFHSITIEHDQCVFTDYCTGTEKVISQQFIETNQIRTPEIRLGDILLFDPKRFHRTNVSSSKHAMAIKFVLKGSNGFLSDTQVSPHFWPEVERFNGLLKRAASWDEFVDGVRRSLESETGRKELSAGFYPEKFDFYRRMVGAL
jgi:hypothetical protein